MPNPYVGAPSGALWGYDPTTQLWLPVQVGPKQVDPVTGEEYAQLAMNVVNANPNGQNTMVNSAPIAIASDQTPVAVKDFAAWAALLGQSFTATTGTITTGAAGSSGLCLFNAATAKNIIIYSVTAYNQTGAQTAFLAKVTADPGLNTALPPVNDNFNGAASVLAGHATYSSTTFALPSRTQYKTIQLPTNQQTLEMLTGNEVIILPAGQSLGLLAYQSPGVTNGLGFNIQWIEL